MIVITAEPQRNDLRSITSLLRTEALPDARETFSLLSN
jgi:hypothetical protein